MLRLCLVAVIVSAGFVHAEDGKFEVPKPAKEHEFLKQFAGEWDCVNDAFIEPGNPPVKSKGSMTGRMIGDSWVVLVVKVDAPGEPYHGQGTFGFDSLKTKRCVGTWTDSMSPFLWKYDGIVDGNKLILNSAGPNPTDPSKMIKARDTWEFKGKDLVLVTGEMEGPDGKFTVMMKATCTRKK